MEPKIVSARWQMLFRWTKITQGRNSSCLSISTKLGALGNERYGDIA